jgi:hypothetical protein
MKIYHYHPEYKYFIREGIAEQSPLDEPGVWLIPAHSTEIEAPNFTQGFISIFLNNSWEIIEDKRGFYYNINDGQEFYNDNPFQVPENSTAEKPPEIPEGNVLKWENGWILNKIETISSNTINENLTPQEKLQRIGLTIDDLKFLLDLNS